MGVTIVLPVSRDNYLKRVFINLEFLECDRENTNLLVYIDGDEKLYETARRYTVNSKFTQKLCVFRAKGLSNAGSIVRRRHRIAAIHNELKTILNPCEFVFLLEDDTLIPNNTFLKLQKHYRSNPYAGFISGVEIGRWGLSYIGGWTVDDPYNINSICSIQDGNDFSPVDASGIYCLMTTYANYRSHDFKPYDNILGPDFDFGISMRQAGYKNYIDKSIKCTHMTQKEDITFQNQSIVQIKYIRENDKWAQTVIDNILVSI